MIRAIAIAGALALLVLAAWTGWLLYDSGHLSRAALVALGERSGPWAPLILMGLMVLAVVIGPIPTVPISVASGAVFGPLAGFIYAMAGALIGAALSFRIARLLGQPIMRRFLGGHIAFCPACSTRLLFLVILVARLLPVVSFAFVSYGAGLTAMRTGAFLLATAIGMVPMTALYVAAGTSLTASPAVAAIGGLVVVILVLLLPLLVERFDPFGLATWLGRAAHGHPDDPSPGKERIDPDSPDD
jgi:uncharacterized membrane protein YdjX (TVP38/TMEM64 family)